LVLELIKTVKMSVIKETSVRKETLMNLAQQMLVAARTAPKGKGLDFMEALIVDGDDITRIADKMIEIGARPNTTQAFSRDAGNIRNAEIMVLLGTRIGSIGLAYCSLCGFQNCAQKDKNPDHPCCFNTTDLGIAVGSAVSKAMDARVDNRIMYTVGMAVKELGIMDDRVKIIYGIPLSASSKNIFFDRK
jgi:uncharacterized ferredoxin-like protein